MRRCFDCTLSVKRVRPVRRITARFGFVIYAAVVYFVRAMRNGTNRDTREECGHSARKMLGLGVLALSILVFASCRSSSDVAPDAAPAPNLQAKALEDSGRAKDDLWRRAASQDPLDLARLADREGAGGLLDPMQYCILPP